MGRAQCRTRIGRRVACWVCALAAVILLQPGSIYADGLALIGEKCQDCHTLKRVFKVHYDAAQWHEAMDRMLEEGADFTGAERQEMIQFLMAQEEEKSVWKLAGTLHFVLNHFPIVLIWVVALFDGMALWRRQGLAGAKVQLLMRLAVPSMAAVILLGLSLVYETSTLSPVLVLHRNIGFVAGGLMLAAWIAREWAVRSGNEQTVWIYRGLLVLCLLATSVAADRGGASVHGDVLKSTMASEAETD